MGNKCFSGQKEELNWCDMPPEIKLECIKKCDVKERLLLRASSRTEHALVDSSKSEIPLLRVSYGTVQSIISTGPNINELTDLTFKSDSNHPSPCLEHLLKTSSEIGIFQLLATSWTSLTRTFVDRNFKIRAQIFMHDSACRRDLMFFLRALDETKIQWIQMNGEEEEEVPFDEIIQIPNVINCLFWQISNYHGTDAAVKVAQIWIDTDAEIGKVFQVLALEYGTLEDFIIEFEDRLVYNSLNLVRIFTDDPSKHIMLELGHHAMEAEPLMGGLVFKRLQFFRLLLVSSESENSNKEEWAKTVQWMSYLDPHFDFPAYKRI